MLKIVAVLEGKWERVAGEVPQEPNPGDTLELEEGPFVVQEVLGPVPLGHSKGSSGVALRVRVQPVEQG